MVCLMTMKMMRVITHLIGSNAVDFCNRTRVLDVEYTVGIPFPVLNHNECHFVRRTLEC
jgi:hypothetical protein